MKKRCSLFLWVVASLICLEQTSAQEYIEGIVVDEQGFPINEVSIKVANYSLPSAETVEGKFYIQLDQNTDLRNKNLYFEFYKTGYIRKYDTLTIDGSGIIGKITLFKKQDRIYGRVVDHKEKGYSGLCVKVPQFGQRILPVKTDPTGEFVLDVSDPGVEVFSGKKISLEIFESDCNTFLKREETSPNRFGTLYYIVYAECRPGGICFDDQSNTKGIYNENCFCISGQPKHPDWDSDGIRDSADRCPCVGADTKSGCPRPGRDWAKKIIPGWYYKEPWLAVGWGASVGLTLTSFCCINKINSDFDSANSQKEFDDLTTKKNWWTAGAITGITGVVLTYILDNVGKKDTSCLEINSNQQSIGLSLSYHF